MNDKIILLKGIHPGIYLDRELRRANIKKGPFAILLNEYPQTLVAITKGRRRMNTKLAIKIEEALNMDEGTLMILQVYHDIAREKERTKRSIPDLNILRPALFWDTDINSINWEKQKQSVIKRVFSRGNRSEKDEITRFYGKHLPGTE